MFRDALIYLFLQVTFIQKPTYVDDMFVHPSYRGQKIATTLFHEMEQKAKEILLEKLEEMAEFTPDTYGDLQGYAVLCSAMVDLYNAIAQNP